MKPLLSITLSLMICCFNIAVAQQANLDSIRHIADQIRNKPLDTAQVRQLRELGHDLIETDSILSKQLLEEALSKSLTLKEQNTITNSYRILGIWYSYFNDKDNALKLYRQSLHSANRNKNLYLAAGANFNIGNVKYWNGEYDSCIYYYIKAGEIFEDPKLLEDKTLTEKLIDKRKSDLYANISSVFNSLKNLDKADEYIDKAIAIARKYTSSAALDAMAYYMQQKADNYSENGKIEEALRIRLTYLPQLETGKAARIYVQAAYGAIATEFFDLDSMDSAMLFAQKRLQLANSLNAKDAIANANLLLARIELENKNYQTAEKYAKEANNYFSNSNDPIELRTYYGFMRQLENSLGHYKEAYTYTDKYITLNDTILKGERTKQYSELEARYQSEKKGTQIKLQEAQLKQKTTLNYLLIGGSIALLLILLLAYLSYKHRQKLQQIRIEELETEKQLTATEAVLKGEEQERTRLAKDLHDGLGGMLSGIKYSFQNMKENLILTPENAQSFERSIDMLDSSIKEMRRVAHNMMPEILVKFGLNTALKDFCGEIDRSGVIQVKYQPIGMEGVTFTQTTAVTIYRIVQELVSNAIKHAAATTIIVQAHASGHDKPFFITVEDDGKGFDTAALKLSRGIGWSNIQNRVDFLKGKIDVRSSPENGTSVLIEITSL